MGKRMLAIGLFLWTASPVQAVSLKEISTWIRRGQVHSLEDVIRKLPADMRSRFVLMERSRSLQEGSPHSPRAVLYGDRAELILSFNGTPGQRGYGFLEAIELDPARKTYELRAFNFTGATPRISPPNPQICVVCHRAIHRPNWEPYPYWPGALGQGPNFSFEELRRLDTFAKNATSHPLYRHLDFRRMRSLNSTPAFELYTLLTQQNLDRIPGVLASSPNYARYRPAILGALADCPQVATWAPELEGIVSWQKVWQDTLRRFGLLPIPYQRILTPAVPSVAAKLRYLLESRGFPVDALPNSFTERFFLTAPGAFIPQLLSRMPGLPAAAPLGVLSAYFQPGVRRYGPSEKRAHAKFCNSLEGMMK